MAFSPDGKLLASAYHVWDAYSGQELRSLENEGPDSFDSVSFRPDGKRLVTGSWNGTVRIFDMETGQLVRRFVGGAGSVAYSPDGKRIAGDSDNYKYGIRSPARNYSQCRFLFLMVWYSA